MMRFFGRSIRRWRAGPELRVAEDIRFSAAPRTIELRSQAFAFGERMPTDVSPPLEWTGVPPEAKTLVMVVEDVDVPFPRPLTHAVAYEMSPELTSLEANALDGKHDDLTMGYNGGGGRHYIAPRPIPGHGPHRYIFTLLAVDYVPRFDQPPTRGRLLDAVAGHVRALGELMGTAQR
ncbi:MAG TPA: YbhB/YbcL family Raf kinase inhibitor-like protein [Candidatus Elarobacter sp.]|jgi:Raf kinase inhibitor-like YbhB/YbcL family protein